MYLAPRPGLEPGTHGLTVDLTYRFLMIYARQQSLALAETHQNCHVYFFEWKKRPIAYAVSNLA